MTWADIAPPLLFAAFAWWFSTGAILWLDRRPSATFPWILAAAGVFACAAAALLQMLSAREDAAAAYVSFAAALVIWGWHEMSFLMGFVTGPRKAPLPAGVRGWRRFQYAAATVMHHELALGATALGLLVLTWGQSNQLGALTFLLLWVLRLSAKFNLFLGAPHRSEALLPPHLAYLGSYFQNRAMNALFPVSMLGGAALVAWMSVVGLHPSAPDLHQTGTLLLMTLAVLGLIEHVFMFLPTPNTALWGWALARAPAKQSHVQPRG